MPSADVIREVLRQYSLDDRSINSASIDWAGAQQPKIDSDQLTAVPIETGFSGAHVWRVNHHALRCWPQEMLADRLQAIHKLLNYIHSTGLKLVANPIAGRAGKTIVVDSTHHLWQLEPWMPGTAASWSDNNENQLRAAFRSLADWHNKSSEFSKSANVSHHEFRYQESQCGTLTSRQATFGLLTNLLPGIESGLTAEPHARFRQAGHRIVSSFRRLSSIIVSELNACQSLVVPMFPVIRDIWKDHLLFEGDQLTGLIDFGAVRRETVACDLSRLMGSVFEAKSSHKRQALDDYRSVRPLSLNEERLIAPLERSGVLLSGMHWLECRYISRAAIKNIERVCDRAEAIATKLEQIEATL